MQFDVAELIQRAGKTRQAELVLTPIVPTVGLERDVLALYMRVVRKWGAGGGAGCHRAGAGVRAHA